MDAAGRSRGTAARLARARVVVVLAGLAAAVGAAAAGAPGAAPGGESGQAAKWQEKELRFTYMGFTTHYSCEGLRDQVKSILLQLGARADLKVYEYGCTASFERPEPFPSVRATFSVLVPVSQTEAASGSAQVVPARWRTVQLKLDHGGLDQSGQCELIEQAKDRIVPLFSTRNLNFSSECAPHQLTIKGATLSVEVMEPVPKTAAQSAPAR